MKPLPKIALAAAATIVIVATAATLVATKGPAATVEVTTEKVKREDLTPQIFGIGTIEARRAYLIGPTQAARVARVLVDQGDSVKAGQLLAEFDPVDLEERARSAALAIERAQAAVSGAEAQVREASSRSTLAAASAVRLHELQKRGFVSPEGADAKQHEANAAAAALDASRAALAAAQRDATRLAADRASIGKQRAQFRLTSPIDGLVTARENEPGSTVIAGQAVIRLIDPQSLWAKVRFDQGRAAGLASGQAVRITLRSQAQTSFPGRVARIESSSDSVTEEKLVGITFDQLPPGIGVGELLEASVALPPLKGVLSMPSAALRRIDQRTGAWRIEGGKTVFVPMRVGVQTLDGRTQVLEGLSEGDAVIAHAPVELRAGMRVRVVQRLAGGGS